jgi:ATP-grasp domain-containing protein
MRVLFCSDPLEPETPDSAYEAEVSAAAHLGLEYALVDYEALVYERDPAKSARKVSTVPSLELSLYRGWMLTPESYAQLYHAIAARNIQLINDPAAYRRCHYLPESYDVIEGSTPRSVWVRTGPQPSINALMELLRPFGAAPVVVKDFVKSQKHYWEEACYIPSAADRRAVERVVRRFVELQGEDLSEGLVFREFMEFEPLTVHSRSGMPLTKEYRIFFLDGKAIFSTQYWEEGDYGGVVPPMDHFCHVARSVRSRFFTMDVAKRRDGEWMIVELGDAQVAGLLESADVAGFYKALLDHWPRAPHE